ncbi:MAG: peptidyl-prolyl cis-trans isomerase, partial [Betaproteobacteria bacterium]|nr:peptidyl-prolyl cis-trans isomerase [Betaproteobacteria bacterium]
MTTQVKLKTSMGDIVIELNEEKAPKTVENFLKYVDSEFYTGTIFHRIINGFMVQGGGMDANMKEKETQPAIENEANNGLKNEAYTIAMARTSDINSATSQ